MAEQPNLRKEESDDRADEERCKGCGKGWPKAVEEILVWLIVFAFFAYLATLSAL